MKYLTLIGLFLSVSLLAQKEKNAQNYWHLEGKVGGKNAAIELFKTHDTSFESNSVNEKFTGTFYYLSDDKPLYLTVIDTVFVKDSINFENYIDEDHINYFKGVFDGKVYSGNFLSNQKLEKFKFEIVSGKETVNFNKFALNQNIPVNKNMASYGVEIWVPTPELPAIKDTIQHALFHSKINTDYTTWMQNDFNAFKKSYLEDVKSFTDSDEASAIMNYDSYESFMPVLNTKDHLVFSKYYYIYSGGAHGNYAEHYFNYNKKEKRFYQVNDIFNGKTNVLNDFINQKVHEKYKIPNNQSLQNADESPFYVDDVFFTNNFMLEKNGITFYYNPYEITPYVVGIFPIYLTYEELKPILNPNFKY